MSSLKKGGSATYTRARDHAADWFGHFTTPQASWRATLGGPKKLLAEYKAAATVAGLEDMPRKKVKLQMKHVLTEQECKRLEKDFRKHGVYAR